MTKQQLERELKKSFEALFNVFVNVYKDKTFYATMTNEFDQRADGQIYIPWYYVILIWMANDPTVSIERLNVYFPGITTIHRDRILTKYAPHKNGPVQAPVTAPTTSILADVDDGTDGDLFGSDSDDAADLELQMEEIDVVTAFENSCRKKKLSLQHAIHKKKRAHDREIAELVKKKGADLERLANARAALRPKQ